MKFVLSYIWLSKRTSSTKTLILKDGLQLLYLFHNDYKEIIDHQLCCTQIPQNGKRIKKGYIVVSTYKANKLKIHERGGGHHEPSRLFSKWEHCFSSWLSYKLSVCSVSEAIHMKLCVMSISGHSYEPWVCILYYGPFK